MISDERLRQLSEIETCVGTTGEMMSIAKELLALRKAFNAPDGWKLVPMEPTKEMIVAGQDKFEECIDSGFDSCEDGSTYEYSKISSDAPYLVYITMLAAAPNPSE